MSIQTQIANIAGVVRRHVRVVRFVMQGAVSFRVRQDKRIAVALVQIQILILKTAVGVGQSVQVIKPVSTALASMFAPPDNRSVGQRVSIHPTIAITAVLVV